MRVKILGKFWDLVFLRLPRNVSGLCDSPETKNKRIRIDERLGGRELLDTFIHEMLHAALWHVDEEFIHDIAHDIAVVLWRLGYRCESDRKD